MRNWGTFFKDKRRGAVLILVLFVNRSFRTEP